MCIRCLEQQEREYRNHVTNAKVYYYYLGQTRDQSHNSTMWGKPCITMYSLVLKFLIIVMKLSYKKVNKLLQSLHTQWMLPHLPCIWPDIVYIILEMSHRGHYE